MNVPKGVAESTAELVRVFAEAKLLRVFAEAKLLRCGACLQPTPKLGSKLRRVDGVRTWVGPCCAPRGEAS